MKNVLWPAIAVGLSLSTSAAMAQSVNPNGFYFRAGGGAALGTDLTFTDIDSSNPAFGPGNLTASTDISVLALVGLGYKFSPVFWADITGLFVPDMSFSGGTAVDVPLSNAKGKIDALAGMVNGYVDVARLFRLPLGSAQPYVMGGIGYSRNHLGTISGSVPVAGFTGATFNGATHSNFAWGAGAGIGIPLGSHLSVDIGYEYLDLGEVRTGGSGTLQLAVGAPLLLTGGVAKADLKVHTIQASLRFGF
jgi:opacity protein-like surface antigen